MSKNCVISERNVSCLWRTMFTDMTLGLSRVRLGTQFGPKIMSDVLQVQLTAKAWGGG